MGCAGEKEKIEDKMMLMKLERMEIQMEKEKQLKKLSDIEGRKIQVRHIPDYIDPKFAEEKRLNYNDNDFEYIKTEANGKQSKKDKNKNKDKIKEKYSKKDKDKKDKKNKKDKNKKKK